MSSGALRIETLPASGRFPSIPQPRRGWDTALDSAVSGSTGRERLLLPHAVAVTTGQQPGLFGGPMYTLHKAVAAAALAAALERAWQRPVVPLFWLAGDDHDWSEATRTTWWRGDAQLVSHSLPPRAADAIQLPMSRELVGREVLRARDLLAADLAPGAPRDFTLDWIDRHWRPGMTLHSAFAEGMTELLEPLGIACIDPTAAAFKRGQVPMLRRALVESSHLDEILAALPDAGTGISAGDGSTLVFMEGSAGRDRLVREGAHFVTRRSAERFSESELLELLDHSPQLFSANVLLRPVVEAALLPTAAYVAGPGELRYLTGQAAALYQPLAVPAQPAVPRWGGVVVDATTERLLERLGLNASQVLMDDGSLAREVLRKDLPEGAVEALDQLHRDIDRAADHLKRAGNEIDPVLAGALPGTVAARLPEARERLEVITADAMTVTELPPGPDGRPQQASTLVANLPYNVAVPVLLTLVERLPSLRRGLVMVQAEVADRLAAGPGSRTYGVPSAKLAWYASAQRSATVGRSVFWPVPNVDSALVRPERRDPPPTSATREEVFAVVDAAFSQRRKTLRSALAGWAGSPARAEELEPLRQAADRVFESWLRTLASRFVDAGVEPAAARSTAIAVIGLLEGAFLLSRSARTPEAVEATGEAAVALVEVALGR